MRLLKIGLPLLALVIAIGGAAFTQNRSSGSTLYFQFTGDQASGAEYRDPANWIQTDAQGEGCLGDELPCVVEANNISGVTDKASFVNYLDSQPDDGQNFVAANTLSSRDSH